MRKHLAALAIVASMTLSLSAYASETDPGSMSLDELKTAYTQLESEKTQIESEKNQLESENADPRKLSGPSIPTVQPFRLSRRL